MTEKPPEVPNGTEPSLELERFHTPRTEPGPQQLRNSETRDERAPTPIPASRLSPKILVPSFEGDEPPEGESRRQATEHHQDNRFHHPKRLRQALQSNLLRWLITVVFVVAIYIVLWNYSRKDVMSTQTKREFNALIVGMSLGLGLSITFSLEAMAKEIRWWILSLRNWPAREACRVDTKGQGLEPHNTTDMGIAFTPYPPLRRRLYLVSQIAVATLGLTYSTSAADSVAILKPGNVTIPDMSDLDTDRVLSSKSQGLSALRYTANSYGSIALAWIWGTMDDVPPPGILWDNNDPLIYCGVSSCKYVFQESSLNPKKYDLVVSTNRSVEVTGACRSWRVTRGGNGTQSSVVIADGNQTEIDLMAVNGVDQTTFMFDAAAGQGTAWSQVTAFEASASTPWYYRCNVSFGPVVNAWRSEHEVSANITSLASSAIALQGYGASSIGPGNSSHQFQSYPAESTYGAPQNGSRDGMGRLMAGFAAGALAVAAQTNNDLTVPGLQPESGVVLQISKWTYVHLILGLTLGVQLLLGVGIAILSN
ncbi:hypothetical protein ACJZ2D_004166 [Fusarium nematophilum]